MSCCKKIWHKGIKKSFDYLNFLQNIYKYNKFLKNRHISVKYQKKSFVLYIPDVDCIFIF